MRRNITHSYNKRVKLFSMNPENTRIHPLSIYKLGKPQQLILFLFPTASRLSLIGSCYCWPCFANNYPVQNRRILCISRHGLKETPFKLWNLTEVCLAYGIVYWAVRDEYCDGFMVRIPEVMRWMNCSRGFLGWVLYWNGGGGLKLR